MSSTIKKVNISDGLFCYLRNHLDLKTGYGERFSAIFGFKNFSDCLSILSYDEVKNGVVVNDMYQYISKNINTEVKRLKLRSIQCVIGEEYLVHWILMMQQAGLARSRFMRTCFCPLLIISYQNELRHKYLHISSTNYLNIRVYSEKWR